MTQTYMLRSIASVVCHYCKEVLCARKEKRTHLGVHVRCQCERDVRGDGRAAPTPVPCRPPVALLPFYDK